MTKTRGVSYLKYIGVCICPKCGKRGYMEFWQSYLSRLYHVRSVEHKDRYGKTTHRCWLLNETE